MQQLGAVLGDGLADAVLEQRRRALVDHRADIGLGIERIAALSFFALASTRSTKASATFSTTRMRFTAVQRWPEFLVRAGDRQLGRLVEVGILHDDQRIVAAELEHDALVAGLLGDVLADPHASR